MACSRSFLGRDPPLPLGTPRAMAAVSGLSAGPAQPREVVGPAKCSPPAAGLGWVWPRSGRRIHSTVECGPQGLLLVLARAKEAVCAFDLPDLTRATEALDVRVAWVRCPPKR